MADDDREKADVVPLPGDDPEERRRIRRSNDRDQAMERQGKQPRHHVGYDEAADGAPRPAAHPADEE